MSLPVIHGINKYLQFCNWNDLKLAELQPGMLMWGPPHFSWLDITNCDVRNIFTGKKTKSLYFERKDTILDKIVQKPIMRKICWWFYK